VPALVQWPGDQAFYDFIAGQELLFVTPLASDVEAHHRTGLAFQLFTDITIQPYGLRCIEAPISIYPNRPERGFEDSLDRALEQVDRAFRQKPFSVFTAACGAYGLPLCEASAPALRRQLCLRGQSDAMLILACCSAQLRLGGPNRGSTTIGSTALRLMASRV